MKTSQRYHVRRMLAAGFCVAAVAKHYRLSWAEVRSVRDEGRPARDHKGRFTHSGRN